MKYDIVVEVTKTGSVEDVANILKVLGNNKWEYEAADGNIKCLDSIFKAAGQDTDQSRKAEKINLLTAYAAEKDKALERIPDSAHLKTLRQLAFESAGEKVVELLKAQANDQAAVQAIIEGAQMDHKRRFRRQTKEAKNRRRDKKDIITEFYAKSGRFAQAEGAATDDLDAKTEIAQLQNRLAEMEKALASQPAKPATLKL